MAGGLLRQRWSTPLHGMFTTTQSSAMYSEMYVVIILLFHVHSIQGSARADSNGSVCHCGRELRDSAEHQLLQLLVCSCAG